ncbi:GHMP kinase [Robertkochia marina]|uniref:GHMP kinase n=1 Tax=Robertkochia marina TaxID=1227945 RepID=A0A4S3M1E4_9FLAO|nr:GYDIA family GHMP kinase [Robertkochia marina]THD68846.1 GHMP kinase [Robertkochia marina]TRZ43920.1 GHMP kinase [Robertkochia marina]
MSTGTFHSYGKLLLTGEYLVLDGAKALALPTRPGQGLSADPLPDPVLEFISLDHTGKPWFKAIVNLKALTVNTPEGDIPVILETTNKAAGAHLLSMLRNIAAQDPSFFKNEQGYRLTSTLEFPRDWGLGSSSTFINNLALWSKTDPYQILEASLGGSGYDLACANAAGPLFYTKVAPRPKVEPISFNPEFKDDLYFIYLNKKQNSRDGISKYRNLGGGKKEEIRRISEISEAIATCSSLKVFQELISEHEHIISKLLSRPTVKEQLFPDFNGCIKSLGAWGGDFILATSENDPTRYFHSEGYNTVLAYTDLIL